MSVVSPARHSGLNNQVRGDTSQCMVLTSYPGWEVLKAEGSLTYNWDLEMDHFLEIIVMEYSKL